MKYRNNVTGAVISLAIFLAFAVAGGICLAVGFAELVANSDTINTVHDIVEYVDDFSFNVNIGDNTERATARYERELREEVKEIVIATGGSSVNVREGSMFSVDFSGSVGAGKYGNLAESDAPKAVESQSSEAYYDHSGIISASFEGGVLTVSVDSAINVQGVNFNWGADMPSMVVTVPASYTGSLEIKDSFAEITMGGMSFDGLTLSNCMGEIDIYNSSINLLTVSKLAGEINVEDSEVSAVDISNIAGEVDVHSVVPFTADSIISDIAGEVNIELPAGSALNVYQNGVLGQVSIDRDIAGDAAAPVMEIDDILGEVNIDIDD